MKEKELRNELYDMMAPLYEAGLDGCIVQDMGAVSFIRKHFPDLPVHVSTQAAVTGKGCAEIWKKLGASRVVPAREMSLAEVKDIASSGLEVECFVHGALCYCYSGQCLYSSLVGGRSGNRGRCAQPCRMEYTVTDEKGNPLYKNKEKYVLSLKDLNTLKLLPKLLSAGVTSMKIEGRMKKAEYAAGVTSIYRKYLDKLLSDQENGDQKNGDQENSDQNNGDRKNGDRKNGTIEKNRGKKTEGIVRYQVDPEDERRLFDLFNRQGFTDGYYEQHNGRDMVTRVSSEFRSHDDAFIEEIREKYIRNEKRVPIRGYYSFRKGEPYTITLEAAMDDEVFSVTVQSDEGIVAEEARNRASDKESAEKQLVKLGNTPFVFSELQGELQEGLFLPSGNLNEFRRKAVSELQETILSHYRRTLP